MKKMVEWLQNAEEETESEEERTVFVAPPTSFVASAPNEDFGAERCPDFRLGPAAAGPHGWTQIPSCDGAHALRCQQRHGSVRKAVKSCNRCLFLKHRAKWCAQFTWLEESCQTEVWGLACKVCRQRGDPSSSSSPWVTARKGCQGKLQVVEFRRHAESDNHLGQLAASAPGPSDSSPAPKGTKQDVPTPAQVRLAVEVAKNVFGAQGTEYERRAQLAGRSDFVNFPSQFNNRHVHGRLLRCLSEILYTDDRKLLDRGKILSAGWAEDVSQNYAVSLVKFVLADYTCVRRFANYHCVHGDKTSLGKMEQIAESVELLAGDKGPRFNSLRSLFLAFSADGEPAEQLCGRFAKESNLFPNLRCTFRCFAHSSQRSLETCLKSCAPIEKLLDGLVTKLSGSNASERGSLARSLKNSYKLLGELQREMNELEPLSEISSKVASGQFSFASQRWDTILQMTRLVCIRISPLLSFLCRIAACGDDANARWARETLKLFDVDQLLLLGLVTEFVQAAEGFVHAWDGKSEGTSPVVRLSHASKLTSLLRGQLVSLFHYKDDKKTVPYVMHPAYEHGYVQLIVKALTIGQKSFSVTHKGKLIFRLAGHGVDWQGRVALLLGHIHAVEALFLQSILTTQEESLGSALAPFDVASWTGSSNALPTVLGPLAKVAQVEAPKLAQEFLLAMSTVKTVMSQGILDPELYWGKAVQHWGHARLPALASAVKAMLCIWESTSQVERDFAIVRHLTSSLKASTSEQTVRDTMKILVDGPAPHEISVMHRSQSKDSVAKYESSPWVKRVQNHWRFFFGSAKNHHQSGLPRRTVTKREKKGIPKLLEAQREDQQAAASSSSGLEGRVTALKKATDQMKCDAMASEKHQSLMTTLKAQANKKSSLVEAIAVGNDLAAKTKLDAHRKERDHQRTIKLARRDLSAAAAQGRCLQAELCVAVPVQDLLESQLVVLRNLKVHTLEFKPTKQTLQKLLRYKHILWCANSGDGENALVNGDAEPNMMLFATRFLGGYVVGPEWFDETQAAQFVVQPILRLQKACLQPFEICLHKSLVERDDISTLLACVVAFGDMRWTLRDKRKELKKKRSWFLASAEASAKKKAKSQGKIEQKPGLPVCLADIIALMTAWSED